MSAPEIILDLTGYRCPMPVIRLEATLRRLSEGTQLIVFADDPVAAVDIPHACREGGHACRAQPAPEGKNGLCVFQVTCGPNGS
jgi:tRNA 2-thiouridine synthesizing protein A